MYPKYVVTLDASILVFDPDLGAYGHLAQAVNMRIAIKIVSALQAAEA